MKFIRLGDTVVAKLPSGVEVRGTARAFNHCDMTISVEFYHEGDLVEQDFPDTAVELL